MDDSYLVAALASLLEPPSSIFKAVYKSWRYFFHYSDINRMLGLMLRNPVTRFLFSSPLRQGLIRSDKIILTLTMTSRGLPDCPAIMANTAIEIRVSVRGLGRLAPHA